MKKQKSFITKFFELIAQHRNERWEDHVPTQPSRMRRTLHWLTPNGGTILLVLILIFTQNVWAKPLQSALNAPGPSATTVNYQGRLADTAGTPLDGTYGITFALYDAATAGNLVWGPESHTAVPVSDGLFSVGLGSQTSGGIPTTTWNGDRYLEITVDGETLSPRELIRSVPIAGMALTVPDGGVTRQKLSQDITLFQLQGGTELANAGDNPGWTLNTGTGDRSYTVNITFADPFETTPVVLTSFSLLDAQTQDQENVRFRVYATNITSTGFDLVFKTWHVSRVYGAAATWIAYADQ